VPSTSVSAAAVRVQEFLRQWTRGKYAEEIYGVHKDPDGEMANLTVPDLRVLLATSAMLQAEVDGLREELAALRAEPARATTPEERAVLRTAVAEYTAGHRADNSATHEYLRGEYTKALTEHYQAVRAYMRTRPEETPTDVRP